MSGVRLEKETDGTFIVFASDSRTGSVTSFGARNEESGLIQALEWLGYPVSFVGEGQA